MASIARKIRPTGLRIISRPVVRPSLRFIAGTRPFSVAQRVQIKKYTEEHEWIEISEDGTTGTIGVSTYAAKSLGDVVFVELPTIDREVSAGDAIGAVESVKSASDILTPVSGTVSEVNSVLEEKPKQINDDPEGQGWIAKIKIDEAAANEIEKLMSDKDYEKFTEEVS